MKKTVLLSALALLGPLGSVAYAEQAAGVYAGVGLGQANVEIDEVGFDDGDTAFKLFGGYAFTDHFAIEVAYFDAGAPSERFNVLGVSGEVEVELSGFNASVVGRAPLGEVVSIFGKIGLAAYQADVSARAGGFRESDDSSENDVSYGVGASFSIGPSFEVRGEWEAVDVSDGSFDVLSISGLYKF